MASGAAMAAVPIDAHQQVGLTDTLIAPQSSSAIAPSSSSTNSSTDAALDASAPALPTTNGINDLGSAGNGHQSLHSEVSINMMNTGTSSDSVRESTVDASSQATQSMPKGDYIIHRSEHGDVDEHLDLLTQQTSKSKNNRILLFFCLLFWGGGFFIVQIPGAMGEGAGDDWIVTGFSISVGRLIGTMITMQYSTTRGFIKTVTRGIPRDIISLRSMLLLSSPIVGSIGYVLYDMLLLQGGDVTVLSAGTSLHVAVPIVFGIFFLKEKINLRKGMGMLLAVVAVLLLSFSGGVTGDEASEDDSVGGITATAAILLFGVIFSWGYGLVVSSAAGKVLSWDHTLTFLYAGYVIYFFVIAAALILTAQYPKILTWVILVKIIGHIITCFGFVLYVKLTSENDTAQWAALTSLYVTVPIILGFAAFGDPINIFSGTGICLSLFAVWMLS